MSTRRAFLGATGGLLLLSGCGTTGTDSPGAGGSAGSKMLNISAIPDQDQDKLQRLYGPLATRFAQATGLTVTYKPVTDYTAVVRAFEIGDIALSWMGGLTGVQARARVPGSQAIAQRNIDASFHSLFIANTRTGLSAFSGVADLKKLAGHTLTFGSETSTSGRLMPEYYLLKSGLQLSQLRSQPGFSGSHDATIAAVAGGSFDVGVVNEQVWTATKKAGKVDLSKVTVVWRTPSFHDYHWLARPDLDQVYGSGTLAKVKNLLFGLTADNADDAKILDLFGATKFVPTENSAYDQIEVVAKQLGLLT